MSRRDRVLAARTGAMKLANSSGSWELAGPIKSLTAQRGDVTVALRGFQELPEEPEATSAGIETLPYGLGVWFRGQKVLDLEWAEAGELEIITYKPGEWEAALPS